jgi:hypothetical protein
MVKKQSPASKSKKTVSRTNARVSIKAAYRPKAAAPKKKAPAKRAGAGPSTAADQTADSEWALGPYGDLISKKDLGMLATTRTRVS